MLTEAEAREKWCPMVRYVSGDDDAPANRWSGVNNPSPCRCIASQCMAWRFVEEHEDRRIPRTSPEADTINQGCVTIDGQLYYVDQSRSDLETLFVMSIELTAKRGYCGAFGKPGEP